MPLKRHPLDGPFGGLLVGLDLIEFTIAIEDAFGIYIPDADAIPLATPALLVNYLDQRLASGDMPACLKQRAFYRLRHAGIRVLAKPRDTFTPDTPWVDLLHPKHYGRQWQLLRDATGLTPWPKLQPLFAFGPPKQTVGDTANYLAVTAPASLLQPSEGWSRGAIEAVVRNLMQEELGVSEFKWTDRFVQDLHLD
jgi:hypothetical protein